MFLNRMLYFVFVMLLAFSPVLSVVISDFAGATVNMWAFMWVGVGLSLPLSLLGARAFGEQFYCSYWAYLESFPGNSKMRVLIAWASMTAITVVVGASGLAA